MVWVLFEFASAAYVRCRRPNKLWFFVETRCFLVIAAGLLTGFCENIYYVLLPIKKKNLILRIGGVDQRLFIPVSCLQQVSKWSKRVSIVRHFPKILSQLPVLSSAVSSMKSGDVTLALGRFRWFSRFLSAWVSVACSSRRFCRLAVCY